MPGIRIFVVMPTNFPLMHWACVPLIVKACSFSMTLYKIVL